MLNEYQRMWIKDRNRIIRGNDIEYLKLAKQTKKCLHIEEKIYLTKLEDVSFDMTFLETK